MAENPLESLIGGEGEEGPDAPGGGGAAAMALALDGAKYDPDLAKEARAYLKQQTRLLSIQTEHLHEQRAVQISHLKLKRDGEFLKILLQGLAVAVAGVVALILAAMIWNATQDHGLIVEPFSVPPDLAQSGVTGQVAAKQVLDRLAFLQAETRTNRPANSYKNNWNNDLKVEIPETGVSLGDVQRLLDESLGHQTHVSGEIFHSPTGLTITARAGEDAAQKVSGPAASLDGLLQQTAEAIYGQTQPFRYGMYLLEHAREPEAEVVFSNLAHAPDALERAWAHIGLDNFAGRRGGVSAKVAEMRLALAEKPDFVLPRVFLAVDEDQLQQEERVLTDARYGLDHRRRLEDQVNSARAAFDFDRVHFLEAKITRDAQLARELRAAINTPGSQDSQIAWKLQKAWLYDDITHDGADMPRVVSAAQTYRDHTLVLLGQSALRNRDPASIPLLLEGLKADQASPQTAEFAKRDDVYWLALAKATFGDVAAGKALIFATPTDCYECVMGRGEILAQAGDRVGAEEWFAQAIRQGPNIPRAFTARGEARLVWGDVAGALADGQAATKISANDPDALKLWGDALARQGQGKAARDKYDAGLKLAPNWVDLQRARAAVAKA